jgi:hypothetical protein
MVSTEIDKLIVHPLQDSKQLVIIPQSYDIVIQCKHHQSVFLGGLNLQDQPDMYHGCKLILIRNDTQSIPWGYVRNMYGFFGTLDVKIIHPSRFFEVISHLDYFSSENLKDLLNLEIQNSISQTLTELKITQSRVVLERENIQKSIISKLFMKFYMKYGIEILILSIDDSKENKQKINQNIISSEDLLW